MRESFQGVSGFREMKLVVTGKEVQLWFPDHISWRTFHKNNDAPIPIHWKRLGKPWASCNPSLKTYSSALLLITGSFTSTTRARNRPIGVKGLIKGIQNWTWKVKSRSRARCYSFVFTVPRQDWDMDVPQHLKWHNFERLPEKKIPDHMLFSHQ